MKMFTLADNWRRTRATELPRTDNASIRRGGIKSRAGGTYAVRRRVRVGDILARGIGTIGPVPQITADPRQSPSPQSKSKSTLTLVPNWADLAQSLCNNLVLRRNYIRILGPALRLASIQALNIEILLECASLSWTYFSCLTGGVPHRKLGLSHPCLYG